MARTKIRELKLFADTNGVIWFGDGTKKASASNLRSREFVHQEWLRDFTRIRLLGFPESASLVCELLSRRASAPDRVPGSIQIGTPAVCPNLASRENPDIVLRQMAVIQTLPPSLGGWHEITMQDAIHYGLRQELVTAEDECTDTVSKILRMHPAWPAVSFVPTHSAADAARLLSLLLDPRWYADPKHPDRIARMYSYLGLLEKNMDDISSGRVDSGEAKKGMHIGRANSVFKAWACGTDLSATASSPESFLWRAVQSGKTSSKGMLKACKMFVSLVRNVWLDNIALPGRTLFVPEYFFRLPEEAEAYRYHVKRIKAGRT